MGSINTASFHDFFESWIAEQNQFLHELLFAASESQSVSPTEEKEKELRVLIDRVVAHYEKYYRVKSEWANEDISCMFSPSWTSSLEDGFLWIGGWRPSMAFHLVYSKSGLQLEAKLSQIFASGLKGKGVSDLGDLTPYQLSDIDKLQRKTIRQERFITEKMAKYQETVADTSMVELSHIMTEMQNGEAVEEEEVESCLASKEEGLCVLLEMADNLRLRTLREVISILDINQTLHFLIAAAELHLRVHEWGKKRDTAEGRSW